MLTQRLRISARLGLPWLVRVLRLLLVERVTWDLGSRRVLFIFHFAYYASYRLAYLVVYLLCLTLLIITYKSCVSYLGNSS
jgi:hypothetical protein